MGLGNRVYGLELRDKAIGIKVEGCGLQLKVLWVRVYCQVLVCTPNPNA